MDSVLGVLERNDVVAGDDGDDEADRIESLIEQRNTARAEKDWAAADAARDALTAMGIEIKDGAQGTTWRRISRTLQVGNAEMILSALV